MTPAESSGSQITLLQHISNIVSSDRGVESILPELVMLTMNAVHPDACLVYLVDHGTNEIVLRASQLPHDAEIGNVRMKMGEGITGWVAAHRSVVALSQNASWDARFKPFSSLQEDTYQAFLSVPLIDRGRITGVLNVHRRERHEHSTDELALVAFIGEQMGGLIARARLAEQSQTAVRRMQTLAAVVAAISAKSYLNQTLEAISQMLAETLDSAVCSVLLVDYKKKELTVSAAHCSAPYFIHQMPIRMQGSLIESHIRQGQAIVIPNIHSQKQYRYPELARKSGLMSLLATPLTSQGSVIGSINLYTRHERAFSDDEVGFVKVVAGQAAIAVRNARLRSETLDMKRTLEARKLIERAKGILQRKHNLTEREAYLSLRSESRRLRRSMADLAGDLVTQAATAT